MAVDADPSPVAALEHECPATGPVERASGGIGGFGRPLGRDPRRITCRPDRRPLLEPEFANARPDVAPLLALDIVEAAHRPRPRAEGQRIVGEHAAARREIPLATD